MPAGARRTRWRTPALLVLAAAYALIAATTTPFTAPADVLTALPVAAMAVLVMARWPWHPTPPVSVPAGSRPYRAWVALLVAVLAWELVNYLLGASRSDHPTLSSMSDAVDHHTALKAVVFFGWLCLGALIVRRGERVGPAVTVSALSYAVWALLGAAAVGLWWASATGRGAVARPAVIVGRVANGPLTRVVLVLGFMWAGWHLFAR